MEKIIDIIESISHEKGLEIKDVKETLKTALIKTAKRIYGQEYEYGVNINEKDRNLELYQKVLVLSDDDERLEEEGEAYICLEEAKKEHKAIEIGDELTYPLPLDNLGRTAAATLQRELEFHIQRLLENNIFIKYQEMVGKSVFGTVVRVDSEENTYIEVDEVRTVLPRKNRIKGEKFKVGNVVKAVIRKVYIDKAQGIRVELSRTSPKFLELLLESEVPEIKDGSVVINKSARIPGERAKVALTSLSPNVDAVGATVGTKGVRINAVSQELKNENIDCIEFSTIPEILVTRALAPAIVTSVKIEDEKAIVTLPIEQKSKAIGKSGINIRLASMLCSMPIELIETGSAQQSNILGEQDIQEEKPQEPVKDLKALFGN
ncbi:MAG: transcription termination/antitermination protein NusA [Campylobacteraceae bacterium]|nr:transcription termination/antitermination protein NusA [Campylobacteraceae bacterium]